MIAIKTTSLDGGKFRLVPFENGAIDRDDLTRMSNGDKNWLATVTLDKKERSGYTRTFWERGAQGWYIVPLLSVGDWIEVGADNVDRKGRKTERRSYFVVIDISETVLIARVGTSDLEAINVTTELERWTESQRPEVMRVIAARAAVEAAEAASKAGVAVVGASEQIAYAKATLTTAEADLSAASSAVPTDPIDVAVSATWVILKQMDPTSAIRVIAILGDMVRRSTT